MIELKLAVAAPSIHKAPVMRTLGIVLTVFGGLMVLSSVNLMLTQYDMSDAHDQSKAFGGLGGSLAILAIGAAVISRSGNKEKKDDKPEDETNS